MQIKLINITKKKINSMRRIQINIYICKNNLWKYKILLENSIRKIVLIRSVVQRLLENKIEIVSSTWAFNKILKQFFFFLNCICLQIYRNSVSTTINIIPNSFPPHVFPHDECSSPDVRMFLNNHHINLICLSVTSGSSRSLKTPLQRNRSEPSEEIQR